MKEEQEQHGPHTLTENDLVWVSLLAWPFAIVSAIGDFLKKFKK